MIANTCNCGCGRTPNRGGWVLGHWNKGLARSVETKIKISKALKGRIQSPEEIAKRSQSMRGHRVSKETRIKISRSLKNWTPSSERGEKVRHKNIGYKHTKETCIKMSESHKGIKLSEEHRAEIGKALKKVWKNKKWSPEQISQMRERARKQHEDGKVKTRWFNTKIERKVKEYLQSMNINFKHQKIIKTEMGTILVDFFVEPNIIIECDGDYWHNYPEGRDIDAIRTYTLKRNGYKMLRFWEHTINKNFDKVKEDISDYILLAKSDNKQMEFAIVNLKTGTHEWKPEPIFKELI